MAKRNFEVTKTWQVEIEVDDNLLTQEALDHFSSYMFKVHTADELLKYVAEGCLREPTFIEGVGSAVDLDTIGYAPGWAVKYVVEPLGTELFDTGEYK